MAKNLGERSPMTGAPTNADEFREYMMQHPENWRLTQKVSYEIWAREAPVGTKVYNALEDADYKTDSEKCVVLSGTRGEQWPVTPAKLAKTYRNPDGSDIQPSDLQSQENDGWMKVRTVADGKPTVFAIQMPSEIRDFPIATSWGEILYANSSKSEGHGSGDYILAEIGEDGQPNLQDMRVVNHDVFCDTYDVSMFPHELQGRATAPPVPEGFVTREGIVSTASPDKQSPRPSHSDLLRHYGDSRWDEADTHAGAEDGFDVPT